MIILAFALPKPIAVLAFTEPLTPKYGKKAIIAAFTTICAVFTYARAWLFIYVPAFPNNLVTIIFLPVMFFIFFRIVCSDKSAKIVVVVALLYALGVLAHSLATIIFYLIFNETVVIDFIGNNSMYAGIIAMLLESLFFCVFFIMWRRYIGKIHSEIPHVGAFLFIIGGQLIYSMTQLLEFLSQSPTINPWAAVGIVFMTVGNLALLKILLTASQKSELEKNLNDIQHIRELEKMHYTAIESRRHEMAKIRHDFNNQLTAVRQLAASGKEEDAEKLLSELESSLVETTENAYCNNPIVNAVLTEKQKECDSSGIALEADVTIDDNCIISPLHLCSVFTNLLDNAIRACSAIPEERRKIELRTAIRGDYLHVKCENPVGADPTKERAGTGYGKIILADIAEHYSGNFSASSSGGTYTAVVAFLQV